jgi:LTXXQ motif family protein
MKMKLPAMLAAALVTAAVPAAIVFAQAPGPQRPAALSADARARLLDGRIAMAKTALNLTNEQLRLWAPVEQHLRASAADRDKRRAERQQARQSGATPQRPALTDRLDRASERMAQRAERMKAFAAVFKPFYASLNDEQKAVAGVVLREMRGPGRGERGHRWASRQGPPADPAAPQAPQKQ